MSKRATASLRPLTLVALATYPNRPTAISGSVQPVRLARKPLVQHRLAANVSTGRLAKPGSLFFTTVALVGLALAPACDASKPATDEAPKANSPRAKAEAGKKEMGPDKRAEGAEISARPDTAATPDKLAKPAAALTSDGKALADDAVLLKRADGSAESLLGAQLRDPEAIARGLGLTARAHGDGWRFLNDERVVLELDDAGTGLVTLSVKGGDVQTSSGVAPGMTLEALQASFPANTCTLEASADGEEILCAIDHGATARFISKHPKFGDLDEKKPADVAAAVGKTTVASIEFEIQGVPAPPTAAIPKEKGVLPAGVYWHPYVASVCDLAEAPDRCVRPAAAVVAGVYDKAAQARAERAKQSTEGLAVGYPMVVNSDLLGIKDAPQESTALVLGLFASDGAAKGWLADSKLEAKVAPLARPEGESQTEDQPRRDRSALHSGPGGRASWDDATWSIVGEYNGKAAMWQVVDVECDAPAFVRWDLDDAKGQPVGKAKAFDTPGC